MECLAHRGWWRDPSEKNTFDALRRALDGGFGIETDIRDLDHEIVISHDMPGRGALPVEALLEYYANGGFSSALALNVKADGLQSSMEALLQKYSVANVVFFDMSTPDTLGYLERDLPFLVRVSDLEEAGPLLARSKGIWLDELLAPWISSETINRWLKAALVLCVVSPELHGRSHLGLWARIKEAQQKTSTAGRLLLCTDYPDECRSYFDA